VARSAGVVLVKRLIFWTNRPAASRHPALTKAGSSRTLQFIHTFIDRAYSQSRSFHSIRGIY